MPTRTHEPESAMHHRGSHPADLATCDRAATADIRAAVRLRWVTQEMVDEAVIAARGLGVTWAEIGDALGISAQGARQRYS